MDATSLSEMKRESVSGPSGSGSSDAYAAARRDTTADAQQQHEEGGGGAEYSGGAPSSRERDGQAGSGSGGKAFQRAYKACDQCRQRKVRCDLGSLEQPLEPPCRRCRRELRPCTFLVGSRGKARKSSDVAGSAPGAAGGANVPPAGMDHASMGASPRRLQEQQHQQQAQQGSTSGQGRAGLTGSIPTPASWAHLHYSQQQQVAATAQQQQQQQQQASLSPTYVRGAMHPPPAPTPQFALSPPASGGPPLSSPSAAGGQYPSHLGTGGVGDYFNAAAAAAAAAVAAPHLSRRLSSSGGSAANGPGSGAGAGGPNGSGNSGGPLLPSSAHSNSGSGGAAGGADHASDASSPVSRASLALIKLSNSSEAVKALSDLGNAGAALMVDDGDEAELGGSGSAAGLDGNSRRGSAGSNKRRANSLISSGGGGDGTAQGAADGRSGGGGGGKSKKARFANGQNGYGNGAAGVDGAAPAAAAAGIQAGKPPRRLKDWKDFEPVRLKIIKVAEARYLVRYFFQHIHGFSPLCSERYMRNSKEMRHELVSREPLLLGAILSIASRFCIGAEQDALANSGAVEQQSAAAAGVNGKAGQGTSAEGGASFGLALHQRISAWTHQLAGRVLVDLSLHSIGSVEGLLLLSEWSTWGIHSHTNDYLNSDDEDDEEEEEEDEFEEEGETSGGGGGGDSAQAQLQAAKRAALRQSAAVANRHANEIATTSERFDRMSWMFIGLAIRLAEELQLQKAEACRGIYSQIPVEIEAAERRLRVWLDCVRADTQISIRLNRRFTSGGLSPEWMDTMRARTYHLPEVLPDPARPANAGNSAKSPGPQSTQEQSNSNYTLTEDMVGAAKYDPSIDEARKWVAWRGHAELANKLRNAHDLLNESDVRTQNMLENERFESILRPFRKDLDSMVRWLEPKIGYPGGGMRTFGIRLDYHFTRLTVFRLALDALVLRVRKLGHADGMAHLGEGLSDRPSFAFAKEAVEAARTLAIVISVDLQSLRCAPPKYFLFLVLAVMVCMQACELSDSLMLPVHCASILREAINALNAVTLDERHLAHSYALMLRNAGKRLLHAEEADRNDAAKRSDPLISDPKLPTISVKQGAQTLPPPPPPMQNAGPSFASDIPGPTQGVDIEDLWSWLGNIDQAVPSASTNDMVEAIPEEVLGFNLLNDNNAAPFFFPNTSLNDG